MWVLLKIGFTIGLMALLMFGWFSFKRAMGWKI